MLPHPHLDWRIPARRRYTVGVYGERRIARDWQAPAPKVTDIRLPFSRTKPGSGPAHAPHRVPRFGYGDDGRLLRGERNGDELPKLTITRTWKRAREATFSSGRVPPELIPLGSGGCVASMSTDSMAGNQYHRRCPAGWSPTRCWPAPRGSRDARRHQRRLLPVPAATVVRRPRCSNRSPVCSGAR
jgi:hypothetical protein